MRHRVSGKKLGRDDSHRKALLRNLSVSLVDNGSVTTTLVKAKYVKPFFERLVTRARSKDRMAVRELTKRLDNEIAVRKLINEIAPKYLKRPGGYTRIVKLAKRVGDNSPMARLELVQVKEEVKPAAKKSKAAKARPVEEVKTEEKDAE